MDDKDTQAALLETRETLQRLTFILERKGLLSADELAEVYGEKPADGAR